MFAGISSLMHKAAQTWFGQGGAGEKCLTWWLPDITTISTSATASSYSRRCGAVHIPFNRADKPVQGYADRVDERVTIHVTRQTLGPAIPVKDSTFFMLVTCAWQSTPPASAEKYRVLRVVHHPQAAHIEIEAARLT